MKSGWQNLERILGEIHQGPLHPPRSWTQGFFEKFFVPETVALTTYLYLDPGTILEFDGYTMRVLGVVRGERFERLSGTADIQSHATGIREAIRYDWIKPLGANR